ncbi:UTP-glucose-1-phosphate uridylyltransferase [Ceratobasidium sp. 428]|nr:UTP-glucose-1-phosphate uridylyltransferase [Ceratobasidium sp. 428]
MNPNRLFGQTPVVKLGDNFKKIANFQKRFRTVPNILELDHLTVAGDVWFGRKVTLRGTVIIVANEGNRIDLPDGSILENSELVERLHVEETLTSHHRARFWKRLDHRPLVCFTFFVVLVFLLSYTLFCPVVIN